MQPMTAVALRTFSLLAAFLIASWLLPANLKAQPAGKRPAASRAPSALSQAKPLFREEASDPFAEQMKAFVAEKGEQLQNRLPATGRSQGFNAKLVAPQQAQQHYNPAGFNPGDVKGNQKRYKRR